MNIFKFTIFDGDNDDELIKNLWKIENFKCLTHINEIDSDDSIDTYDTHGSIDNIVNVYNPNHKFIHILN